MNSQVGGSNCTTRSIDRLVEETEAYVLVGLLLSRSSTKSTSSTATRSRDQLGETLVISFDANRGEDGPLPLLRGGRGSAEG